MSETMELQAPVTNEDAVIGSTRCLDESGHVTLAWAERNIEAVTKFIREKMARGFKFYIIKDDPIREEELRRVADLGDEKAVRIHDADADRLFRDGHVAVQGNDDDEDEDEAPIGDPPADAPRTARTAEEAARRHTVSHRARVGG